MAEHSERFEEWAIVELMGHRRLAGRLSEQVIGGQAFLRLDVPETEGQPGFTQFYGGGAVYCITPTTEEIARETAALGHVEPVSPWELGRHPALRAGSRYEAPEEQVGISEEPVRAAEQDFGF